LIDDWLAQSPSYGDVTPMTLEPGIYPVLLKYWEWGGESSLKFKYSGPDTNDEYEYTLAWHLQDLTEW
jgi:hypothetical protein